MPDALPQACTAAQLLPTATVRRAQGQRALALAELKAADAQLMPTLSVDGSASRGLTAASRPAGYPDLDMRVMFNVSAPLFEEGATRPASAQQGTRWRLRTRLWPMPSSRLGSRCVMHRTRARV